MKQGAWSLRILALAVVLALGSGPILAGVGQAAPSSQALLAQKAGEGSLPVTAQRGENAVSLAWTRSLEPVILQGSALPEFIGASITDLFAFAYSAELWQPIPLQIDEVSSDGTYGPENGLLDSNDELAFMAVDLGETAPSEAWIPDPDSQQHARYAVLVTNPLAPSEKGWVYLYQSATLAPPGADYVDWNAAGNEIVGGAYVVGYDPSIHPLMDSLELNGTGVDVLDRSKLRVSGTCWIQQTPHTFNITEEDLPDDVYSPPTIDGRVRVGGGTLDQYDWSYYAMSTSRRAVAVSSDDPPEPCTQLDIYMLRQSSDLRDPAASGMAPATYYDSNTPAGVAVNGAPDSVPSYPPVSYRQISGALGTIVDVVQVDLGGGSLSNYYLDSATPNFDDTGDYRSFADAGFRIDNPTGNAMIEAFRYYLDPGRPNMGATYVSYRDNPLEATATAQNYVPPCEPVYGTSFAWAPEEPEVNEAVTFSAGALGSGPIEFAWNLGDGTVGAGALVTHSYAEAGTYTVTLTASNPCGQQVISHQVIVTCDQVHDTAFTWEPETPGIGQDVMFTAQAEGSGPLEFAWDFGDGTAGTGAAITHVYAEVGTYTVTLTVSNPCGQQIVSAELLVECEPVTAASFSWEPPLPDAGKVVTFTGEATGTELITYDWTFGDGQTGGGQTVTHIYVLSGTYTVELEAANACGQATVTDTLTVLCRPPSGVDMSWEPGLPPTGEQVTFSAEAEGSAPMSFEWVFGDDGSTASGSPVSHTFAISGTFPVTLTVTNTCGAAPPLVRQVHVHQWQPTKRYLPALVWVYRSPIPPPCEEMIENGGFEDQSAWYVPVTPRPARYTTEKKRTGAQSILLGLKPGEADLYSYSSARQAFTVPDVASVTLSFWFLPVSDLDPGDRQECLLLDENDSVIANLMQTNIDSTDWLGMSYDLTAYAGQTVKVYFNTYNDGDGHGVAGMYVDDVSVQACTTVPPEPDCYPALGAQVAVGHTPHGVAVNGTGKRAYVVNNQSNTLSIVDTQSYARLATVAVGDGPNGVAYNPGNNQIYVSNGGADSVTVLRASDYGLVKTIAVGTQPGGIAVDAGANRIFVANYWAGTVSVIDGATNSVVKTINIGSTPAMIATNSATHKAYVTLYSPQKVAIIDSAFNLTLVDIYSEGPHGVTVDATRNLVYVATIQSNRIAVIDGATDSFVTWVEIRRSDGAPVPLRMIGVNADIGTSGHVFLTTVGEDGGFDKFLLLPKGWPEGFARPIVLDVAGAREGLAFEPITARVFVTSRTDDTLAVILDGENLCPQNFSIGEYQLWICTQHVGGTCTEYVVR